MSYPSAYLLRTRTLASYPGCVSHDKKTRSSSCDFMISISLVNDSSHKSIHLFFLRRRERALITEFFAARSLLSLALEEKLSMLLCGKLGSELNFFH